MLKLSYDIAALTHRFALAYRDGTDNPVSPDTLADIHEQTDHWFGMIPVPITWVAHDPYSSCKEMANDIRQGMFKVHCPGLKVESRVFGRCYRRFRAVHDYYGHYRAGNGFGLLGELSAYGVHAGMFSRGLHPLIFNELILVNSYRDHFGEYSPEDKLVLL